MSSSQSTSGTDVFPPSDTLIDVRGQVTDADGKPLVGVNVVIKGTQKGTITDPDGNFILIDVNRNSSLLISSIGYETREVKTSSANSNLVIALNISSSPLDEVQIIAYGTTTKRFSTGNVSTVKAKEIEKQPVNDPVVALSRPCSWFYYYPKYWCSKWSGYRKDSKD